MKGLRAIKRRDWGVKWTLMIVIWFAKVMEMAVRETPYRVMDCFTFLPTGHQKYVP